MFLTLIIIPLISDFTSSSDLVKGLIILPGLMIIVGKIIAIGEKKKQNKKYAGDVGIILGLTIAGLLYLFS
ncbi:hypothetical protein [Ornithinibacillus halophilus]|uniref:Uncharacterized protein n=1 Tax=Ornithinibacillus halophilus TaxID=930117 RepID=A0A1M5FSY0_9BACI|nr:hypothetical protein [Ornithinibacillus halophilus]SHF94566.1 hypothetical protein SAMN05216225_10109 [Ornithinibacillus halophilus]